MDFLSADNGCLSILDPMVGSRIQESLFSVIKDNPTLFEENKIDDEEGGAVADDYEEMNEQ